MNARFLTEKRMSSSPNLFDHFTLKVVTAKAEAISDHHPPRYRRKKERMYPEYNVGD